MEVLGVQRWVSLEVLQPIAEVRDAGRLVGFRCRQRVQPPRCDVGTARVDEQKAYDRLRVGLCEQGRHRRAIRVRSDHEWAAHAGRIKQRAKVGDLVSGRARRFRGRLRLPSPARS